MSETKERVEQWPEVWCADVTDGQRRGIEERVDRLVLLKAQPEAPELPIERYVPASQLDAIREEERSKLLSDEDQARLGLIRDHDGNDLSPNDKALLTRLSQLGDPNA